MTVETLADLCQVMNRLIPFIMCVQFSTDRTVTA